MATRHVTVGVDGSLIAVRALDRAAEEAALRGTGLEIVYAVSDLDEAGPVLASAVSRVRKRHPGLSVTAVPVVGHPAQMLAALGRSAALTVVGTRGFGGVTGLLFGSVSMRLAAHTDCPLLVVRGDHRPSGHGEVLLAIESDADADAAAYAFAEAERRGARLWILHTRTQRQPAPEAPTPVLAGRTARMQDGIGQRTSAEKAAAGHAVAALQEKYPQIGIETRNVGSGTAHALLQATRAVDVVVIAAHRRPERLGLRLGPVPHALLHRAHCPVVLVPDGRHDESHT
ncbi:universal stress protein [Streptomyces sp. NBC_00038]|uniref:universal stress protein n=1 Tax=Streptomyces sp. NBC_00038 TaxID=2903615 RepID=UPI00225292D8|nr:universal stress protein [Streptomyces sp. NBC_00038]MCX5554659.1 universal stress protein [Streptomyces sp. NBC_00038]